MFVDASAIVAILTLEPGFEQLAERLRVAERPMTSAVAVYEAVLAVTRKTTSFDEAYAVVWDFVALARIEIVSIGAAEAHAALAAFARYGKGRGHPAQLNMGDCSAYAYARGHGAPLLLVGDDFSRTDIASASP